MLDEFHRKRDFFSIFLGTSPEKLKGEKGGGKRNARIAKCCVGRDAAALVFTGRGSKETSA